MHPRPRHPKLMNTYLTRRRIGGCVTGALGAPPPTHSPRLETTVERHPGSHRRAGPETASATQPKVKLGTKGGRHYRCRLYFSCGRTTTGDLPDTTETVLRAPRPPPHSLLRIGPSTRLTSPFLLSSYPLNTPVPLVHPEPYKSDLCPSCTQGK